MQSSGQIASGKVREIFAAGDDALLIVTTDRISAFDVILPTPIPGKGILLNTLSEFWFSHTKDLVKNHLISTDTAAFPPPYRDDPGIAGRAMLVRRLRMLPVECIVRGYLAGSGWASYQKDGTVCGIALPSGLRESDKLPAPIFTPSTKAAEGHDENISFAQMEALVGPALAAQVRDATLAVYQACADYALTRGIIIADTKLEFGLDADGSLVLADEVLTPDSSRFWSAADYRPGAAQKSFDKQYLRDWLKARGLAGVTPAPVLPADVVEETLSKYRQACAALVPGFSA